MRANHTGLAGRMLTAPLLGLLLLSCAALEAQENEPSVESRIEKALKSPAHFEFIETPLSDVAVYLGRYYKVPVLVDERRMREVGMGPELPITFESGQENFQAALEFMLSEVAMTAIIDEGTLLFTTREAAERRLTMKVYDVRGLLNYGQAGAKGDEEGNADDNANQLMLLLQFCVSPTAWLDATGGPGSLAYYRGDLIIRTNAQNHRMIERLLAALRTMQNPKRDDATTPRWNVIGRAPPDSSVWRALAEPTVLHLEDVPLPDVVKTLRKQHNVSIQLDWREVLDDGPGLSMTFQIKGVSLAAALTQMLEPYDLAYLPLEEGLLITSRKKAEDFRLPGIYDLSDLPFDADMVIELITSTVTPTFWSTGRETEMTQFGNCLAVPQNLAAHKEVIGLLDQLRQLPPQVPAAPATVLQAYPNLVAGASARPVTPAEVEQLVKFLEREVSPQSWKSAGGANLIEPAGRGLLIRAPQRVHQEVDGVLEMLQVRSHQIAPESTQGTGLNFFSVPGLRSRPPGITVKE